MPLRAFLRPAGADILLLAAWPILLLLVDAEWAYTRLLTLDPWVYFGSFVNLSHHLTVFGETYYLSRLSWILPGYAAHALLPPVPANISLHLAVFYAGTFGCYSCLRMTVGRRPALVAALLLGAYQPFLDAAGWDYVDGAGISYFLLALACGTAAARADRPWMWNAASGAFASACVITNVAWLLLMPGYVAYLLILSPRLPLPAYARRAVAIGAGALAVLLACSFVFATFTGSYWFFLSNAQGARLVSQASAGQPPASEWVWATAPLGTACALFLVSLIRLVWLTARGGSRSSFALHGVLISSSVTMLALQLAGIPVLRLWYYASYLLPGMALAAGDLLARPLQQLSSRAFGLCIGIGAAAWLVVFDGPGGADWLPWMPPFGLTAALVGLAAGVLAVSRRSYAIAAGLACVLLLMLVQQYKNTDQPGERRRNYQLTADALDQLRPIQEEKRLFFWYSDQAPRELHSVYMSTSSGYLWGFRLFSAKFPARTRPEGHENEPRPGQRIVLLTDRPYEPHEVEEKLGAAIDVVREMHLSRDGLAFTMTVFDVR